MSHQLFNTVTFGQYCFNTQVIELDNDKVHRSPSQISKIINTSNPALLVPKELEIYQTYIHEMTHFLDHSTTLWGLEYTYRIH